MTHDHSRRHATTLCFWRSRCATGLVLPGAAAAYFLLSQHQAHVLGPAPLLLVLVLTSALIHTYMHSGQAPHELQREDARDAMPRPRLQANETPAQSAGQP